MFICTTISRGILVWKHCFNQAPACTAER